ncbi:MAG TPA: hypothetical protein VKU41_05495 [Polyangiaceae bacterium]|nr:hypothetical protein [Polyangiaceae bacterium]
MRTLLAGAVLGGLLSLFTGCNALLDNKLYELEAADGSTATDATASDAAADQGTPTHADAPATLDASAKADAVGTLDATQSDAEDAPSTVADSGVPEGGLGQDGGCTSLSDIHSCGSCSNDCARFPHVSVTGLGCTSAHCTYACAPGYGDCADAGTGCTTPLSTPSNCGGCGVTCSGSTSVCVQSDAGAAACGSGCLAGQTNCSGSCSDLASDANHCGACGTVCPAFEVCTAGACKCPTEGNPDVCGTACTNKQTDAANCGACGHACASGESCVAGVCTCPTGQTMCGGTCVDLSKDPSNCGTCGTSCAQLPHVSTTGLSCAGSVCSYQCAAGYADCGNTGKGCTTPLGTATNCSACGVGCSGSTPACGPSGSTYACDTGCSTGQSNCSGTCTDVTSDPSNCGACGKTCPTGETCQASVCGCSTAASPNYCGTACTNTQTDNNNCGTCSHVCPSAQGCSGGTCVCPSSTPTFCTSTNACVNTTTDSNNCGSCAAACTVTGETCVSSACKCPSGEIVCAGACVMPNICGGCGTISGTLGGTCGMCGTLVCSADKTSLTCNDPGTTNMCPTWCSSHPAPSSVAASDYACADFDHGTLPSGWTATAPTSGSWSVTTARANSTPDSLLTSLVADTADSATLAFSPAAGASSITSLSFTAELDPVTAPQIVPTGSSGMDLMKISVGGNTVRLGYTVQGTDPSGGSNPYTGLYVDWIVIAGAAVSGLCPVSASLNLNVWNTIELDLDLSNLGAITVVVNGVTATSGCNASNGTDTVATMTVGPASPNNSNTFSWSGYWDNVQATVRR